MITQLQPLPLSSATTTPTMVFIVVVMEGVEATFVVEVIPSLINISGLNLPLIPNNRSGDIHGSHGPLYQLVLDI